jgi:hypothetical protein
MDASSGGVQTMLEKFDIVIEPEGDELLRLSLEFKSQQVVKIMTHYKFETTPKCFLIEDMWRDVIHKAVEAAK